VLPFYVLHETVIVVVAYVVLTWPIGGGAQYCLIALVSLAATLLIYDLGIGRNPVARFLFGLKQPRGPSVERHSSLECCMRKYPCIG
jgi:hypothetical protein